MAIEPWVVAAIGLSLAAYAAYLASLRQHLVEPNRSSWLIWSVATVLEAVTYGAVNPGTPATWVLLASALACVSVTVAVWNRSIWSPTSRTERACVAASLLALGLWLFSGSAWWAHLLVVAAVPVSFWPTWASVLEDAGRERSPAWWLWTLGDLATLAVALRSDGGTLADLLYLLVEFACHASVWALVVVADVRRAHRARAGRASAVLPVSRFRVGRTHLGKAVFAVDAIAEGAPLMRFTGRRRRAAALPALLDGAADRFVQVTPDTYMGPSGRIDDLVNHSCDPNAGLRFADDGIILVALRPIAQDEEISWDYSTTLRESNWHMLCQCRSPQCRRVIGNFASLPPERQEWLRARNVVAPYLRRRDVIAEPGTAPVRQRAR